MDPFLVHIAAAIDVVFETDVEVAILAPCFDLLLVVEFDLGDQQPSESVSFRTENFLRRGRFLRLLQNLGGGSFRRFLFLSGGGLLFYFLRGGGDRSFVGSPVWSTQSCNAANFRNGRYGLPQG